jgi:F420 biosynthesis protein FbiB-like protein
MTLSKQLQKDNNKSLWLRASVFEFPTGLAYHTGMPKNVYRQTETPQPTLADILFNLMKHRRSIRRYTAEPIPQETILRLLEAATWAPSAHNRQPWRFAVLTQAADKERLVQAMGARLRADRTTDGDDPADIERDVARSYTRLTGAPVLIIICLSMAEMDSYPDLRRARNEWLMAAQSTAMAAQNLLLLAHAEGLAACWVCAPLFVPDLVRDTLALSPDWEPQGLITLGRAAEVREKSRMPIDTRVKFL